MWSRPLPSCARCCPSCSRYVGRGKACCFPFPHPAACAALQAPPDHKVPILYVLDAILKAVGEPYIGIARDLIVEALSQAIPSVRVHLLGRPSRQATSQDTQPTHRPPLPATAAVTRGRTTRRAHCQVLGSVPHLFLHDGGRSHSSRQRECTAAATQQWRETPPRNASTRTAGPAAGRDHVSAQAASHKLRPPPTRLRPKRPLPHASGATAVTPPPPLAQHPPPIRRHSPPPHTPTSTPCP